MGLLKLLLLAAIVFATPAHAQSYPSQDYAAFIAAEQAKWSRIVNAIGFKE